MGAGVGGVSGIKIFKFIIYLFQNTQPTKLQTKQRMLYKIYPISDGCIRGKSF